MGNAVITLATKGGKAGALAGMTAGTISAGGAGISNLPVGFISPLVGLLPTQVLGLVPLLPCVPTDCRILADKSIFCYLNPVFGTSGSAGTSYTNDLNSFFLNYQGSGSVQFTIQRQSTIFYNNDPNGDWTTVATIANSAYGTYYPIGSIPGQPTYLGFIVNWGLVLAAFGPGIYRISVNVCILVPSPGTVTLSAAGASNPGGLPGTFTGFLNIGGFVVPVSWSSLNAANLAYICALINASGIDTATVVGSTIVVLGPKGSSVRFTGTEFPGQVFPIVGGAAPVIGDCTCAYNSVPFLLRAWNCDQAHGTVKFECWKTGVQGDVDNDGSLFQLCNTTFYDSIRARGFFGYTEFGDDTTKVEWGVNTSNAFGLVQQVRDKVVRGYQLKTYYWPQWLINRIYVYGFTTVNPLLVSDYNKNNSDYYIQRRSMIKDDGMKPDYLDKNNFEPTMRTMNRTGISTIKFKQGIQSLISSIYCQITS